MKQELIPTATDKEIMESYLGESKEVYSNTKFDAEKTAYFYTLWMNGDGITIDSNDEEIELTKFLLNDAEKTYFNTTQEVFIFGVTEQGFVNEYKEVTT